MNRVRWSWSVMLVFTLGGMASGRAADRIDPVWLDKLKTDGRAACQKYETAARGVEEVFEVRAEKLDPADPTKSGSFSEHTDKYRFVRVGDNLIVERTRTYDRTPDKPQCTLDGLNPDYYFTLSRGRPDAAYALASYAAEEKKRTEKFNTTYHLGLHREAFDYLRDLLKGIDGTSKEKLVGIEWDAAKQAVRVVSTFVIGQETFREDLWVDPAHDWRTVELRREGPSGGFVNTLTYGREAGGMTFPTSLTNITRYTVAGAPPNLKITYRLESIRVAVQGEDAFRLTAFGLPEPVDIPSPPKRTPRYVWWVLAAVGFAAVMLGFRYLARCRRAVKVPAPA